MEAINYVSGGTNEATRPLLPKDRADGAPSLAGRQWNGMPWRLLWPCTWYLTGIMLVNIDSALMAAAYTAIGSEFEEQQHAAWLKEAYIIVVAVSQLIYSRLSDVFGAEILLLAGHVFFGFGIFFCFFSQKFWQLVLARGLVALGAAAMWFLVSIIFNKTIHLSKRAFWQFITSIFVLIGHLIGDYLGGVLVEKNWRLCLLLPLPFTIVCIALISFDLITGTWTTADGQQVPLEAERHPSDRRDLPVRREELTTGQEGRGASSEQNQHFNMRSAVDLLVGIVLFIFCVGGLCASLSFKGDGAPWTSPKMAIALMMCLVGSIIFVLHQSCYSTAALIQYRQLIKISTATILIATLCKDGAESGFLFVLPWYSSFTSERQSVSWLKYPYSIGLCLGQFAVYNCQISWTKRPKSPLTVASVFVFTAAAMMHFRWPVRPILPEIMFYGFLFGLGTGAIAASLLVTLIHPQVTEEQEKATKFGAFHLVTSIASLTAIALSNSLMTSLAPKYMRLNFPPDFPRKEVDELIIKCLAAHNCTIGLDEVKKTAIQKAFVRAASEIAGLVAAAAGILVLVVICWVVDVEMDLAIR